MHEHTALSPWVSGDKGNNMYPDLDPEAVPWEDHNQSVTNTEGDISSEGEILSTHFSSSKQYATNLC